MEAADDEEEGLRDIWSNRLQLSINVNSSSVLHPESKIIAINEYIKMIFKKYFIFMSSQELK